MKILKIIYYIVFASIVAIVILLIVSILPITGNVKFMIVQSGSMEPMIKKGSIVMVKPATDYNIGDVITFNQYNPKNPPITHRIVEIKQVDNQISYITKGDANKGEDGEGVSKKDIVGKVLFNVPYIGYVVGALKKPQVFLLAIIIPALFIIINEAVKIKNEFVKIKNKSNG